MERTCEACGASFDAASAKKRFCEGTGCKRARARGRKQKQMGTVVKLPPAASVGVSVFDATLRELEAAGRVESASGQAALALARRIDDADGDTGSSTAAVAKQFQALMAEALRDVKVADDPLDELQARRARRRAKGA